jgi:hypothetical protein
VIRQLRSVLKRRSRRARLVAIAALGVVVLNVVASALAPTSREHHRATSAPTGTGPPSATTFAGPRYPPPVSAGELARARGVTGQFLESYLPFLYGRASARSVAGVTPAFRRQLTRERAQLTPVERRRRPRLVSLLAAGEEQRVVLATAMVEDGGITTYALRITVPEGPGGWLVTGVDGR